MQAGYLLSARTRRLATGLKWLSLTAIAATIILGVTSDLAGRVIAEAWARLDPAIQAAVKISDWKQGALTALAWISLLGLILILLGAARVFAAFETGLAFSQRTVRAVRAFGLCALIAALLGVVTPTLLHLVMTIDNPPGQRTLSIAAGSQTLVLILVGAITLVIGQILTEAMRIAEENGQFV